MSTHWCHGVSVSGPVDPSGCCADQPEPTHGAFWPSDYVPGEDPSCLCGYNGTPKDCAASRKPPTAATLAAGLRAEVDRAAADRLAKGLRGGRP